MSELPNRRYSYRFVFAPATIGAITWLAQNFEQLDRIKHGLILSLLGDPGHSTYKRSRFGDSTIDRIVEHVLASSGQAFESGTATSILPALVPSGPLLVKGT